MAALVVFLPFALCFILASQSFAPNEAPCQPSKWKTGYNTFMKRHIPSGAPTSLDQNQWEAYIKDMTACDRPTQSFLSPEDLDRVRAVCTAGGGKTYKKNMCISRQPFTFVTVRSEPGTCGIRSVRKETKHLILACEVLYNQCLPVHFEGNPENLKPDNNARGCQDPLAEDPHTEGHAPSLQITWLCLLSVLLVVIYGY